MYVILAADSSDDLILVGFSTELESARDTIGEYFKTLALENEGVIDPILISDAEGLKFTAMESLEDGVLDAELSDRLALENFKCEILEINPDEMVAWNAEMLDVTYDDFTSASGFLEYDIDGE